MSMSVWISSRKNPDGTIEKFRAEDMGGYICIEQLDGFQGDEGVAHLHLPRESFLRWARAQSVPRRWRLPWHELQA